VGDTTNLAARLQQTAQPGSVVISAATHQHVSGFFETRDLGEMLVKGRAPVQVFEVLRPRGRRTRFDVAVERGLTPLVGREWELATLRERFSEVKAGQGQVVGIAGEAGMGKSRLVLEFRRALAQAGEAVTWREGHCISFGQASPFLPLIELLRENFQIDELDGEPEIIAKVEQGMRRMGELEAYIPAIRYLLSVDPGDPALAAMEGAARRRHLFAALRALSLHGARRRPLVLVVEDLHWIDTSSEEFLNFMLDAVAGVPLLLLVTYRIGYTPPFGSRSFYTTLTLRNFSETETLAMASHVLRTAQFPAELQTALMEKAEGVPLFIEEVTKTLLDLGVLRRENGSYRLVKSLSEVGVPDTIQGIIMARLDRLGEDGKRTVQLASVIGRQFLVRLLARIAGLRDRLEGLLHELQALELIYEQGLLPEPAYIFKHAVIQDVAYNSLLRQHRKALHRAVGEAIEELYQDRLEEHYTELVHHFSQAEFWEKAFNYCRQAGEKAMVQSAYHEAVTSFEQALAALAQLPERHDTIEQAIDLRCDLRNVLLPLDAHARIFDHLHAAEVLAERLGDDQRLGRIACYLCISFMTMSEHDRAIVAGQRALALATSSGAFDEQVVAQTHLGIAYYWAGDFRQALDTSRQVVRLLTGELCSMRFGLTYLPAVISRGYMSLGLAEIGDFVEGADVAEEAVRLAEAAEQPFSMASAHVWAGILSRRQGALHTATAVLERGLQLCQSANISFLFPMVASSLGAAYALAGRITEALPLLDQMLERVVTGGRTPYQAFALAELSEAYLLVGHVDEASTLAERLLELSRTHIGRGYQAHAYRLLGDVAIRREPPDIDQATAHYRQVLALADALGMRPLLAHCHYGLGILYNRIGRPGQARTELSVAVEMYRAMDMTFWLERAEAMLTTI
jgi:tetratricopeptide (TPR) repeat protein